MIILMETKNADAWLLQPQSRLSLFVPAYAKLAASDYLWKAFKTHVHYSVKTN